MAYRFIPTEILEQKWIRVLTPKQKAFLFYLFLRCDNGGVIELDIEVANLWVGEKIGDPMECFPPGLLNPLQGDYFFVPEFLTWLYKDFYESNQHQRKSGIKSLIRHGLYDPKTKSLDEKYLSFTQRLRKDCAYDNENGNESDVGNEMSVSNIPFSEFWTLYDKNTGNRVEAEASWVKLSDEERVEVMKVLPRYRKSKPQKQYRKNPDKFLKEKCWEHEIITDSKTQSTSRVDSSYNKP